MKFEISSTATTAATMASTFTASFDMCHRSVVGLRDDCKRLGQAAALHRRFRVKAVVVAEDRRHRQGLLAPAIAHDRVAGGDVAVDVDPVPGRGVDDIVDGDVVVLAPEERHGGEPLAAAEHVARGDLALALGHDPMLDAHGFATASSRPAGDVAGGEDAGNAGLESLVDQDAAIERQPGARGEIEARPD